MKKKHIIIGSILVIGAIALGSTLAWWTWTTSSNEQTNVVVTVGGITINYDKCRCNSWWYYNQLRRWREYY